MKDKQKNGRIFSPFFICLSPARDSINWTKMNGTSMTTSSSVQSNETAPPIDPLSIFCGIVQRNTWSEEYRSVFAKMHCWELSEANSCDHSEIFTQNDFIYEWRDMIWVNNFVSSLTYLFAQELTLTSPEFINNGKILKIIVGSLTVFNVKIF